MTRGVIGRLARQVGARPSALTRREVLLASLAAGSTLMLADRRRSVAAGVAPSVVVIGAGFGGLSCGYQLTRAGARVSVVEARPRVGGRVCSLDRVVEGKQVEGGAEWMGLIHPTWLAYAKQFQLTLHEQADTDEAQAPILLNGRRYIGPEVKTLWGQIDAILQSMNADARGINGQQPWLSPRASSLDQQSLAETAQRWPGDAAARHGALTLLANDMNCWPERYSYLAMLASIAAGGVDQFWTEREVYRCASGNQSLAFKLAAEIGDAHLRLRTPVVEIDLNGRHAKVKLKSGATLVADAVVLTAPPSTWEAITMQPPLPQSYRISAGQAIKVLSRVDEPFWKEAGLEPESLSDGAVGTTWQGGEPASTSRQRPACLTVFAGGRAADRWLQQSASERSSTVRRELDNLFPGTTAHLQKQSFWLWPEERWTRCGYSAPAPGEVSRVYPLLETGWQDKLFFAGEYASPGFYGHMEGGLQSGAMLAKRLAQRLNLSR
jgi:monoamine oxidase